MNLISIGLMISLGQYVLVAEDLLTGTMEIVSFHQSLGECEESENHLIFANDDEVLFCWPLERFLTWED